MTRLTMNFDAVAAATPLDRTASTVRDGSGDLWEAKFRGEQKHWKAPPPPEGALKAGMPDYTGRTFGRLTVVRFHGFSGQSTPVAVWLVRCACGDYEVRRAKTIGKALGGAVPQDHEHSCMACRDVQLLQRRAAKPSTTKTRTAGDALLDALARGEKP
jgi:hypothetical protein